MREYSVRFRSRIRKNSPRFRGRHPNSHESGYSQPDHSQENRPGGGKTFSTSLLTAERPWTNFSRAGDRELRPLSRRCTDGEKPRSLAKASCWLPSEATEQNAWSLKQLRTRHRKPPCFFGIPIRLLLHPSRAVVSIGLSGAAMY